jgi:hypothetical protein
MVTRLWLVLSVLYATAAAEPSRDWHAGANLRTDFGARFYRIDFGVRLDRLDLIVVTDPYGVVAGDYDLDAIARYDIGGQWSVWGGARETVVPIGRDRQYTEKALVGISGLMPSLGTKYFRVHGGVELAVHVHSHGGGIMDSWVCVDSPTCRKDHFVFGLFGRFEFASAF